MKNKLKSIYTISILGIGLYFFSQKEAELNQLWNLSLGQIAIASAVILISHLITGLKFRQLFNTYNLALSAKEWFGLPQIRKLGNLIFFKSGTITNAYYLNNRYNLPYSKFIIAFSAEKITSLFALALMGLVISISFFMQQKIEFVLVILFFVLLSFLIYFLFFFSFHIPKINYRIVQKIVRMLEVWNEFKKNRSSVIRLIIFEVFAIFALALRFYVAFRLLNHPVNYYECIAMSVATSISGVINLVPGGLGIRESVVGLTALYFNHGFDYGIIATVLDRILSTLWFGALGFIYFHILSMERYERKPEILADQDSA